jgi:integrase
MAAEGIQVRHSKACEENGGRCKCKPSYRAAVYDRRTKKYTYGPGWQRDKAAVVKWRTQALREIDAHTLAGIAAPGNSPLLSDAWHDWIAGAESGSISNNTGRQYKSSTLESYKSAWSKHLEDEFGERRLATITRFDLQRWANEKAAAGMPRSTLNNILDPLRVLYRRAFRHGEVATNPTADLDLPAKAEDEIRIVSREEAQTLIAALPLEDRSLWAAAFYTGLRRSELRALRCADVDFEAKALTITRAWTQQELTPKSQAGVRRIPLTDNLADELRSHLKRTKRSGDDLVFGRTASDPFVASTIRARALKAWGEADPPLDPIGLHQCRHTYASFLIAAGANAKALSVVMGHASIEISFNRYGHLMPGAEEEVGKRLHDYLAVGMK